MVSKRINIEIPTGLNLRPAGDLCNEASKYNSKIEVHTDKMIANAKSVLNILGACIKMGDVVTIVCEGDDEVEALNAVIEVLEKKYLNKLSKEENDMAKASLVVMAAGIGSRFGKGLKQLEGVGPKGEIIMDYSIYDAIEAGFDKVVFITRKSLEDDFKRIIGDKVAQKVEVAYAFQEIEDLPKEFNGKFTERTKPWGTGQAILACKDVVNEPFMVINADDYYGKEAFKKMFDYLTSHDGKDGEKIGYVMAGYYLKNTLSDNGTVTRGVIKVENGCMSDIEETYELHKVGDQVVGEIEINGPGSDKEEVTLTLEAPVSMNMWGLYPSVFSVLEEGFKEFLGKLEGEAPKGEYLLPMVLGDMVKSEKATIKVLETNDKWFGMTYAEDVPVVKECLQALTDKGMYEGI